MEQPLVQRVDFKVDTSRPHSRSKLRGKIRHILAVASGMFPLMALFIFLMSLFRLEPERTPYYRLTVIFLGCGMVTLLLYAWARSEKQRRREISARNRELKYRMQADKLRQERARRTPSAGGPASQED